jgi:hypothetical protein
MRRSWLPLFIVVASVSCLACHESRYAGDGELTDSPLSPSQRFSLTLGPIDMRHQSATTFTLNRLPARQFIMGFQVSGPRPTADPLYDSRPITALARMSLTDETGRVVIDETAKLEDWVWSGSPHEDTSFVYRAGTARDVPLAGGGVTPQLMGVKADAGWGSSFTPRSNGKYLLRVEILEGDARAGNYQISLKGLTGGWE